VRERGQGRYARSEEAPAAAQSGGGQTQEDFDGERVAAGSMLVPKLARPEETWAGVVAEGVQLRYAIPRPETILSRDEPTSVLVGRATLAAVPERFCVPAQDLSVWVRGRTRNTSEWALLPGVASVYVGSEFLGTTALERVAPGAELELALGLDPRLTVERTHTEDERQQPGVFGSKVTDVDAWKVVVKSTAAEPVTVLVHETLPRARDERIEVKLDRAAPQPLADERAAKLREERGVLTFALAVPPRAEATLEWRQKVAWPEVLDLLRY
ncbi:MAG TPA: DUF4139 domain-containing protein, partial [Planctomycetota bacterium]|nr:DUF4139 domain-containing protein [Planctomycetota bacterium]